MDKSKQITQSSKRLQSIRFKLKQKHQNKAFMKTISFPSEQKSRILQIYHDNPILKYNQSISLTKYQSVNTNLKRRKLSTVSSYQKYKNDQSLNKRIKTYHQKKVTDWKRKLSNRFPNGIQQSRDKSITVSPSTKQIQQSSVFISQQNYFEPHGLRQMRRKYPENHLDMNNEARINIRKLKTRLEIALMNNVGSIQTKINSPIGTTIAPETKQFNKIKYILPNKTSKSWRKHEANEHFNCRPWSGAKNAFVFQGDLGSFIQS